MSCDAAALALTLHLATFRPAETAPRLLRVAASAPAPAGDLAKEPLFAAIVADASRLKGEVAGWRTRAAKGWAWRADELATLEARADALSKLDMQGHLELAKRGTDGDLKCILRGLSQDLPRRMADLKAASEPDARKAALDELFYLLRDNVEVVTTPERTNSEAVAG